MALRSATGASAISARKRLSALRRTVQRNQDLQDKRLASRDCGLCLLPSPRRLQCRVPRAAWKAMLTARW
jgi:hypothetical protein